MGADVARRQWGAEKITETLPTVHPIPSGMKMALGRLAIVATVLFWAIYVVTTIIREFVNTPGLGFQFTMEAISYLVVVTFLTFSALMHLIARQGAMERFRDHRRTREPCSTPTSTTDGRAGSRFSCRRTSKNPPSCARRSGQLRCRSFPTSALCC